MSNVRRHYVTFNCTTCGGVHEGLPHLGFRWPDPYFAVPEVERDTRVVGTTDTCVIDDEAFYIRGVILIPIIDAQDSFGIGAWVSQKRANYQTYLENFESSEIGPFFGWLSNRVPFYEPDTFGMKSMARFQGSGQRPLIELEPSDHPLYLAQSQGLTIDRAWQLAHEYL